MNILSSKPMFSGLQVWLYSIYVLQLLFCSQTLCHVTRADKQSAYLYLMVNDNYAYFFLQSLLRIRCFQNMRSAELASPRSTAESELGLLRQRQTVSELRCVCYILAVV